MDVGQGHSLLLAFFLRPMKVGEHCLDRRGQDRPGLFKTDRGGDRRVGTDFHPRRTKFAAGSSSATVRPKRPLEPSQH